MNEHNMINQGTKNDDSKSTANETNEKIENRKKLSFWQAFIPFFLGIGCVLGGVLGLGMDSQIPLLAGTAVVSVFGIAYGYRWQDILKHMFKALSDSMSGILILLFIGCLMGAWIACGSVPYIIYIGMKIISPQWFLLTACLMCAILSAFTGTSWSTVGTLGIAFMGIGYGLGIPPAMVAGAIVSGSWFGDKQSPLSDTTNFAPIIAGTTLYKHMRSMLYTTSPALVISLLVYGLMGLQFKGSTLDYTVINSISGGLETTFNLTPWLLVPPLFMIIMVVKKADPFITLISASFLGVIFAVLFQGQGPAAALTTLHYGFVSETGVMEVDQLLSRGGLNGMMWTVSVLMIAIPFGASMEYIGIFETLIQIITKKIKTASGIITAALLTDMALIYCAGELFTAMLITGRSYAKIFDEKGLDRSVLSRTMEDGGTMFSPLCPWNPNAVVVTGALGVATFSYAPYAIMNWVTPIFAVICAFTGYGILKAGYEKAGSRKEKFINPRAR